MPAETTETTRAGLNLHARSTPVVPDEGLAATGSGTPPAWPRGPSVEMGRASVVPAVQGVERVVASLQAGFRRCYEHALQTDPNLAGSVALEAKLGADGHVGGVKMIGAKGLPPELLKCLSHVLDAAPFAPPPGGSATLTLPFTLTH